MTHLLLIILIVLVVSMCGAIIYFANLPFKIYLQKRGKLTELTHQKIKGVFALILCLVAVASYFYINHRDSNKRRLEEITEIKLPASVIILHDEYQDMGQDYKIIYNVHFDSDNIKEFVGNIKLSKFYNYKINTNSRPKDSLFVRTEKGKKAIWYKSANGYSFSAKEGIAWHSIELDTLKNILKYNEVVF